MDFFSKFKYDFTANGLHKAYKNCIANEVSKYMENGTQPSEEFCLEEKKAFYNALHNAKKIEADSIEKYYIETIVNGSKNN